MEATLKNRSFALTAIKAGFNVEDRRGHCANRAFLRLGVSGKTFISGLLAGLLGVLMCTPVLATNRPVPGATTVSVSLPGMSIVTKVGATARVMAAATNLATVLHQITGATFPIITGNGTTGIAVGVKGDFPSVSYFQNPPFDGGGTNCTQREDYLLLAHTSANGVYVCGSTELGVEDAVWDFLHRVGYRYYFPSAAWEMIPTNAALAVNFNVHESPDFIHRRIWSQGGNGWWEGTSVTNYGIWQKKNRTVDENPYMFAQWGWECVMQTHPQEFNFSVHPDYFPMVNGSRVNCSYLFCALNPAVMNLCASYTTNYIATHPAEDVVPMVPPDTGAGFCDATCPYCGTKSLSDRMVLLANYCGVALRNAGYVNKRVSILAYASYTTPPTETIEPEVIAVACAGYASDGKPLSFGDLINQWNAKRKVAPNPAIGSTMGIYEYYSQISWGGDMPNRALHASDFNYVADEIPSLYNRYKCRYMDIESEVNFGICGLGYYLASRLLWDTALSPVAVKAEFFTNCFGTVACQSTMREFYDLISEANRDNVINDGDTVGRMYALLKTAREQASGDQKITDRINQLVLYARFCELNYTYSLSAPGTARTNAMAALATHMYRMKDLSLAHTFALWLNAFDPLLPAGDNRKSGVAEGTNPWKVTTPFAANEYGAFITNGLAAYPPYSFTPIRYSKDLVKATPLNLPTVPVGYFCSAMGDPGDGTLYTWIDPGSSSVTVYTKDEAWGQMMYLYSSVSSEANLEDRADVVHTASSTVEAAVICEADRVTLGTTKTGLHRIRRLGCYTQITWVDGVPMTIPTFNLSMCWQDTNHVAATMYFYVPKGTTNIWFRSTGLQSGVIKDSNGDQRYDLYSDRTNEQFGIRSVAVPAGQAGKLWKIENYGGMVHFFNVPPYIARSGAELLLPREVVEADSPAAAYGMTMPSTMYAGGTFLINWTAPAGHSATDWITLVDSNNAYDWGRTFYTGTTNTSGAITNWAPTTTGNYTLRYMLDGGWTEVTTIRGSLTVTAWPGSLTATPSTVTPGGDLDVNWTAPTGHSISDWIGIYNDQNQWVQGCYLNTTATSGLIEWWAPTTTGSYTMRYFVNGSSESVYSTPLTVGGAYGLTVPSTVSASDAFLINWTAPAGHSSLDWIAIVNSNNAYIWELSFHLGTTATSGEVTDWAPTTPGNYTVRYMLDDGWTEVTSIRCALTVTP